MNFQSAGYLVVQSPDTADYFGVDRTRWPLCDEEDGGWLENEQDCADMCDGVLGNLQQAESYQKSCKHAGIHVRLLYCKCTASGNCIPPPGNAALVFCGMDYAYPNGDYYSSVLNEVIGGTSAFAKRWKSKLNAYGLIASESDMDTYIKERTAYAQKLGADSVVLEKGFFSAFSVYLCVPIVYISAN